MQENAVCKNREFRQKDLHFTKNWKRKEKEQRVKQDKDEWIAIKGKER